MTEDMIQTKSCEDGEICSSCTLGGEMLKLGITPRFKINTETGHCEFFTDEPHTNSGEYDHAL